MSTALDSGLARLELLREFKRKMPRIEPSSNVGPFDDRVSTSSNDTTATDLSDIHDVVRLHLRELISDVRDGRKQSQVVLLSGAAGTGKTHLLRSFARPASMQELGHVFVGGSNHWTLGEFQEQLLDWIIEALTRPSPTEDHPLLLRVQAIGFRAVEHLLSNPVSWKTCLARPRGPIRRLLRRFFRPNHATLKALTAARDPQVFDYFDDAAFSKYVCDRFLADRSNISHRFALRVLLTYLFPDRVETGVGTRERVLHWFRGRAHDEYFSKRLGSTEQPDRAYTRFEAVKLLAHLFSPAVSSQLATEAVPCTPRVLLLTFDQAEGRNELFDSDDDWRTFFAHLSELYNSLSNVVVLFTMTLALRNRLHGLMERQFRDRIRMDDKLTLALPTEDQIAKIYRSRIDHWLRNDTDIRSLYAKFDQPLLPFDRDELTKIAVNKAIREALENLDKAFHEKLANIVVDVALDYLYARNELKKAEDEVNEWDYTADHLETIRALLTELGEFLGEDAGVQLQEFTPVKLDTVPTLKLVFHLPNQNQKITIHLARLGNSYNNQIPSLIDGLLYDRERAKNFLMVVRPKAIPDSYVIEPRYAAQFFRDICPIATESMFVCLLKLNKNRGEYEKRTQVAELDQLILEETGKTYLRRIFGLARTKLDDLAKGVGP